MYVAPQTVKTYIINFNKHLTISKQHQTNFHKIKKTSCQYKTLVLLSKDLP